MSIWVVDLDEFVEFSLTVRYTSLLVEYLIRSRARCCRPAVAVATKVSFPLIAPVRNSRVVAPRILSLGIVAMARTK